MDRRSCMSENLEATDRITDRSTDFHPHCNIIEDSGLFEDDVDQFLFLDSQKGDSSSSLIGSQHIQALEQTLGLIDSILQPTNCETMSVSACCLSPEEDSGSLGSGEKRPKSFLHDEMYEFNQIFSELVSTPQRKFPCRDPSFLCRGNRSAVLSKEISGKSSDFDSVSKPTVRNDENVRGLLRVKSAPFGFIACESNDISSASNSETCDRDLPQAGHTILSDPDLTQVDYDNLDDQASCCDDQASHCDDQASCCDDQASRCDDQASRCDDQALRCDDQASCLLSCQTDTTFPNQNGKTSEEPQSPGRHLEGNCSPSVISDAESSTLTGGQVKDFATSGDLKIVCANGEKAKLYEPMKEEDADSGYQTGDSSVPAMVSAAKKLEGVASLSRDDLLRRIEKFNSNKLGLAISLRSDSNVYEGNIRVHLNIYRPIKMSLSSRPSSIYDILIRTDTRLPENESSVAFFRLPSNTFKAIHISSETTTNAVIKTLLTKFNITDNPKRFALYERILPNEDAKKVMEDTPQLNNTLSFVRRLADDDRPLELCLRWADHGLDLLDRSQFVLQENDPGEIMWEDFSLPELKNFLRILSKEERCYADQIRTRYRLLRRETEKRLQSFENEKKAS